MFSLTTFVYYFQKKISSKHQLYFYVIGLKTLCLPSVVLSLFGFANHYLTIDPGPNIVFSEENVAQ